MKITTTMTVLALAALAATGCQRSLLDAPCPCLDGGWACCQATQTCLPQSQMAALCADQPAIDAHADAAMSHTDGGDGAADHTGSDGRSFDAHADASADARADAGVDAPMDRHADAAADRANDAQSGSGQPDGSPMADPPIPAWLPSVCTSEGWCWTHPLPAGDRFVQALGVDAHEVWVIGAAGTVLRSIDGVWSALPSPTPKLSAIWATAANDVWVGGDEGIFRWNGAKWTFSPTGSGPTSRAVKALWGCQPDELWEVGNSAMFRWDGSQWMYKMLPELGLGLVTVWGSACNDVWAGAQGAFDGSGAIIHWDGSEWSTVKETPAERILGTGPDNIWSMTQGRLFHWGTADADTPVDTSTVALFPVGSAAIGTMNAAHLVSVRAGGAATVLPVLAPAPVTSLWGRSATDIWGVGAPGVAEHWDGADWTSQLPGWALSSGDAVKVTGSGSADIWVAAGGTLLHYDGSIWRTALTPEQVGGRIWDIWAPSPDDVWVLGGDALIHRGNTAGWHTEDPPLKGATTPEMRAISGTGPQDVWIVRGSNSVLHLDGDGWHTFQPGVEHAVDVWASGPGDAWVVGDQAAHWDGGGWLKVQVPNIVFGAPFVAVSGSGASDVWALAGGSLLHASTKDLSFKSVSDTTSRSMALSVAGPGDVWLLVQDDLTTSRVRHFANGVLDPLVPDSVAPAGLNGIWAAPDGTIWTVGDGGAILRKRF